MHDAKKNAATQKFIELLNNSTFKITGHGVHYNTVDFHVETSVGTLLMYKTYSLRKVIEAMAQFHSDKTRTWWFNIHDGYDYISKKLTKKTKQAIKQLIQEMVELSTTAEVNQSKIDFRHRVCSELFRDMKDEIKRKFKFSDSEIYKVLEEEMRSFLIESVMKS